MGMLVRFTCLDCGYSQELRWGVGMRIFDQSQILKLLDPAERQRVEKLLEEDPDARLSTHQQLFYCSNCGRQQSRLAHQLSSGDQTIYRPEFSCSICDGALEREEEIRWLESCPECGSVRIQESTGDWD